MFGSRTRPVMPDEFNVLARYNAQVGQGLVHTQEWRERMAELQERFNAWAIENRNLTKEA